MNFPGELKILTISLLFLDHVLLFAICVLEVFSNPTTLSYPYTLEHVYQQLT